MAYDEDDYLMISGLQHFSFCRRRWGLVYLEQQWADNYRTTDGSLLHKNAHDPDYRESRGDVIVTRAMKVHSATLGISGECDVVEFHKGETGIPMAGREGLWQPFPVEYKRGKPSEFSISDALQLCAQALCLEEMLCCPVPDGALYYGEVRHRHPVTFSPELRAQVQELLQEMHDLARRGVTPKVRPGKQCNNCSLNELCLPKLPKAPAASVYIRKHWEEEP